MKITRLDTFSALGTGSSWSERWARQAMHALLGKLTIGSLLVEEDGQVSHYGEDPQHATLRASIRVRDAQAWLSVLRNGDTGAGEAYMHGLWDTPDLVAVIRLFVSNMAVLQDMQGSRAKQMALAAFHWLRRNSRTGSRRNIAAHYDLGNDFFRLFLDDTLAYSAGIFEHREATLYDASIAKFERICRLLELKPSDHLLEIGTGWGGLAIHAAKHYGCRVTTTTLSHQQFLNAQEWVAREGLGDRITVLERDYRDLEGKYDKLVSVEMIEAVGAQWYPDYFRRCSALLQPHGLMMLQAITISDQRYRESIGAADFIKRYIFPGGQLPCTSEIASQMRDNTDMLMLDLKDITLDYALTLRAWRERFHAALPQVRELGCDETFIRMWRYYLCFCEGGFLERVIQTGQYLLAKPGYRPAHTE